MKKLISLVIMCLASMSMMAQTSLVATLTHEGASSEFYGQEAFVDAVKASADGDLITLSAGTFSGTTINKSLTIRGNGAEPADKATIINTKVILEKSADENEANHWLNIEGIYFNCDVSIQRANSDTEYNKLKDLCMKKCTILNFTSEYKSSYGWYGTLENSSFINCRILKSFNIYNISEVAFINSIVYGYAAKGGQTNNPKVNFLNSVYILNASPSYASTFNAINSIILLNADTYVYFSNHYYHFPPSCSMDHCILTGFLTDTEPEHVAELYDNHPCVETKWMPMSETFKTLTEYTALNLDDDYSLTDAAQSILGTDGTQIGIYGGAMPYSSTVTYPRFKTFNVAEKAVDGKLSVEIATE